MAAALRPNENATAVREAEWRTLATAHKVRSLGFSAVGDFFLLGTEQGGVEVWDGTAMPLRARSFTLPAAEGSAVVAVAWSWNNQLVFAAAGNGVLAVFDLQGTQPMAACRLPEGVHVEGIKTHPADCTRFVLRCADSMPLVVQWTGANGAATPAAPTASELPGLEQVATVWQLPLAASGEAGEGEARRGDAAWHPERVVRGQPHALLYGVGARGKVVLWDAATRAAVGTLPSPTGLASACDLDARLVGGAPLLCMSSRQGIAVMTPASPEAPADDALTAACAAVGVAPLVRAEGSYAEPVDSTLLCTPALSADGAAVTALPVPGQPGHFNTGLFIFARGAVGDMQLRRAPKPEWGSEGFSAAGWCGRRAALVALTLAATAQWLAPTPPCTFPGPMYPPQFQLYPGNREHKESESEWDVRDEEGTALPVLPPSLDTSRPVDVVGGRPPVGRAAAAVPTGAAWDVAARSALPALEALPPFLGTMTDQQPLQEWTARLQEAAATAIAADAATAVRVGGRKRPRTPDAPAPAGRRGSGRFRALLTRAVAPGEDKAQGAAVAAAAHAAVAAFTGEALPAAVAAAAAERAPKAARTSSTPSDASPAGEVTLEEAVHQLMTVLSAGQEGVGPPPADAGGDDGLYAGCTGAVAAMALNQRHSKQLLGLMVMHAQRLLAQAAGRKEAAAAMSPAASRRRGVDAAAGALVRAATGDHGGDAAHAATAAGALAGSLTDPEVLAAAEEAAFAFQALRSAHETAAGAELYKHADSLSEMLSAEDRRLNELRMAANRHRSRLLAYSQAHGECNRAWGIVLTPRLPAPVPAEPPAPAVG